MPLFGFRWNAEFILIGYTGKIDLWPTRKLLPLAFSAPNIKHSQKPDVFYERIQTLGKDRVDVFARAKREGWATWGDEVG
jgi:N6-adenosine-specific RNA methylase IME4